MDPWLRIGLSARVTGTVASLASTAALGLLAKGDGKGVLQPINATSHWLHGDDGAKHGELDVEHTAIGFGTHKASALFWALPFEVWLAARPPRSPFELLRDACAMSAIAAAVDYGATPKRFTPGWELVLSKRSLLATYGALALGLAGGAMLIAAGSVRTKEKDRGRYNGSALRQGDLGSYLCRLS